MRGCFGWLSDRYDFEVVFPAYAGMFLGSTCFAVTRSSSPRVCGDVSLASDSVHCFHWFSLRMRGCFLFEEVKG